MKSLAGSLAAATALAAVVAAAACGGTTSTPASGSSGSSGSSGTTDDGGTDTTDDAGTCDPATCDVDAATDPKFTSSPVCTSKTMWTRGDRGSASMHPGKACIDCHDANRGPSFTIAGTVFPTGHEPDDCNGATGATVVITDANGKAYNLAVNSAGNFYSTANVALPFHAKVVVGGKERAMVATQKVGDCNSCHTETGAMSAPGRIATP